MINTHCTTWCVISSSQLLMFSARAANLLFLADLGVFEPNDLPGDFWGDDMVFLSSGGEDMLFLGVGTGESVDILFSKDKDHVKKGYIWINLTEFLTVHYSLTIESNNCPYTPLVIFFFFCFTYHTIITWGVSWVELLTCEYPMPYSIATAKWGTI